MHCKNPEPSSHKWNSRNDEKWMERALVAAMNGASRGEVPVGAVLIKDNRLIAEGSNSPIGSNDPTAHAEIVAIRQAATFLDNYRLAGTTLYVTLEPCVMCVGAMIHARIDRLVYGTADPKSGAVSSLYTIAEDGFLNHSMKISGPVLEYRCALVLKNFFAERRKKLKQLKKEEI